MHRKTYEIAMGKLSTYVALVSFGIGTLLYVAFDLLQKDYLIIIGIFYICFAIMINLAVLLNLLLLWITQHRHRIYFSIKIGILLANIPIALLYLYLLNFHHFLLHF